MNKMLQMFDPVESPGSRGLHPNNCVHFQENSSSLFVPILSCWIAKHRASKHNFGNAILATDQFCLFWKLNFLKLWELFFVFLYFLLPECLAWIGVRDWSRGLPPSGISLACLVGGPHNAQDEVKIPNGLKWGREVANKEWLWVIRNEWGHAHCIASNEERRSYLTRSWAIYLLDFRIRFSYGGKAKYLGAIEKLFLKELIRFAQEARAFCQNNPTTSMNRVLSNIFLLSFLMPNK